MATFINTSRLSQMSANTLRRAAKVAKIDFVEMEFSPFETAIEVSLSGPKRRCTCDLTDPWSMLQSDGVLEACKELGVRILTYSPLGKGALTGKFRSQADFKQAGDSRGTGLFPRFAQEAWEQNLKLVEGILRQEHSHCRCRLAR